MKPDRPPAGAGFIRKLLNQACLKHHISIGNVNVTVFDPLKRCVLCGKKHINFVLDPGRYNKLHNLQLRTFLLSSMCVN